jgi:hypothetical protein
VVVRFGADWPKGDLDRMGGITRILQWVRGVPTDGGSAGLKMGGGRCM